MVLGWRRSFCTSIPQGEDKPESPYSKNTFKFRIFSSNPSTPRFHSLPSSPRNNPPCPTSSCDLGETPEFEQQLKIANKKTQRFFSFSNPSSPRTSSVKSKDIEIKTRSPKTIQNLKPMLKVYNDDEPLMSAASIPESEEENSEDHFVEFQGFFVNNDATTRRNVIDVKLLPETAVVSAKTYVVVLKVKAPAKSVRRAPTDLVAVIDVSGNMTSEKLQMMKRCMRLLVSSLSAADRLSIVAFSTASKRLMPLRRMTAAGRRSARRIVDAIMALNGTAVSATDAVKKAAKVLEDRRDKNPTASIILLSDGQDDRSSNEKRQTFVCSTRFPHLEIPVHLIDLQQAIMFDHAPNEDLFAKTIRGLLYVVVQNLKIELDIVSGSAPAEIKAVYSYRAQRATLGSGSIQFNELYAEEERELFLELKVPSSTTIGFHCVLSFKCSYKDPTTGEPIHYTKELAFLVPRAHAVKSETSKRLKNRFVSTRAIVEAHSLIERKELVGAQHMLTSTRSLLMKSGSGVGDEFVRELDSALSELHWQRQNQVRQIPRPKMNVVRDGIAYVDEKDKSLTATSSWRAAEKLAKLAILKKSLNRVSDLHGFENARF